jgi:hypothetical protein
MQQHGRQQKKAHFKNSRDAKNVVSTIEAEGTSSADGTAAAAEIRAAGGFQN